MSRKPPLYSTGQFALSRPHEELGVIVSSCTFLAVEGDGAVGVRSDLGAQLLRVCKGQDHIRPIEAVRKTRWDVPTEMWRKLGR